MKKLFIIFFCTFLVACSAEGEQITCNIDGKETIFTINEGIITSCKINGEYVKRAQIDEINGTYFTSATNNEEGKISLDKYVDALGGTCNYD